jgi:predicted site-specific integrase-resolvase
VNLAENGKEDLLQDFISITQEFCARIYGRRRSKCEPELGVFRVGGGL